MIRFALIFHKWGFFFPCFDCLVFPCFILLRSLGKSSPRKMLRLGLLFTVEDPNLFPRGKTQAWAGRGGAEPFWEREARGHHMMPLVRYWKPS